MLKFQRVTLDELEVLRRFLSRQSCRTCDYTVGGVLMWRDFFNTEFAVEDEALFFKVTYPGGSTAFPLPVGTLTARAAEGEAERSILRVEEHCRAAGIPMVICAAPDEGLALLRRLYGDALTVETDRAWCDYLYHSGELAEFPGRRYRGQRNHVNKFTRLYPGYRFVPLGPENRERARDFLRDYLDAREMHSDSERHEGRAALEMLDYFDRLGAPAGCIEAEGQIVALSIGEIVGDTLFIHVEKALREYPGSYQVMVSEFARHFAGEGVPYLNREEDDGEPGLRASKLAYLPCALLEKHRITVDLR